MLNHVLENRVKFVNEQEFFKCLSRIAHKLLQEYAEIESLKNNFIHVHVEKMCIHTEVYR